MAQYEHLELIRLPERFERRKTGGGGAPPKRDPADHSTRLTEELDNSIGNQQARRRANAVDPALILRVKMAGPLLEEEWQKVGLTLLASDEDRTLVLFADNDELTAFRTRLAEFSKGTPEGRKAPAYNGFVANIDSIGLVEARDRIGRRARQAGFTEASDFQDGTAYIIDVELWDLGRRENRIRKLTDISEFVLRSGGAELDQYVGPSITMARFECDGVVVRNLLNVEEIAELDFLPEVDLLTHDLSPLTLAELPPLGAVDPAAPLIGILDSGVNAHPLIEDLVAGRIAVPNDLGGDDALGHGTFVSGIAVFGDLRSQLANGTLNRGARLCVAKVVDDQGRLPNKRLVARQMREALSRLNSDFGCRIFVISLSDKDKIYDGGKVGAWSATLDEMARELNAVIIVSAGNRKPRAGQRVEEAVQLYPQYLLEPSNQICEPAGALNVVTVGAIAHHNGIGPNLAGNVGVIPIAEALEPSPFTRVGPGVGGALKPDVVDLGGTLIYDNLVAALRGGESVPEAGMMSLHNRFLDQLFTFKSGTSFSAPLVAYKASQILARFPTASANLVRALLAGSAHIPEEGRGRIAGLGGDALSRVFGNGHCDLEKAVFSDDARVVFYAEDELLADHFAVYQVPIPDVFRSTRGRRHIRVTLAYDPPVRHSRQDYAGTTMSFRLIRGCQSNEVFEHYRRRTAEEGRFPDMAPRFNCDFIPSSTLREKSSLQSAIATFARNVDGYGDVYYLVVRCESGWAGDAVRQAFAVTVELAHEAQIQLYARLTQRVRVTG
jgi:hypothetical protein